LLTAPTSTKGTLGQFTAGRFLPVAACAAIPRDLSQWRTAAEKHRQYEQCQAERLQVDSGDYASATDQEADQGKD